MGETVHLTYLLRNLYVGQEATVRTGHGRTVVAVVQSLSRVQLFATPWTVAHQDPLSMGILQAEYIMKNAE